MHRRTFLTASAATLAGLSAARCGDARFPEPRVAPPEPEPDDGATLRALAPARVPEDLTRFPRGVQAGMMTSVSALLHTHVSTPGALRLRVWRDSGDPTTIKLVHEREVDVREAGPVKEVVRGLGPGHYRFAYFTVDDAARSVVGRFRTAFAADDLRPLTIAGLACTSTASRPFAALARTATLGADVLVHVGDLAYCDGAVTLEEYRERWRDTLEDADARAAYASAGLCATWDDHELLDNLDPERVDPAQLAAATQAYYEAVAVQPGPQGQLWQSFRWGLTAELFVLDCRTERRPSTRESADAQYISPAQLEWLRSALAASPCHFKIVLNSVPITDLFGIWDIGLADRWEGYASQRKQLVDHLVAQDIPRVYFLSGDFHCAFVARIDAEGPARRYWEILLGPTAPDLQNPIATLADAGLLPREEVFPARQFEFGSGHKSATTTLVFDPLQDTVRVRYVCAGGADDGKVLYDAVLPS